MNRPSRDTPRTDMAKYLFNLTLAALLLAQTPSPSRAEIRLVPLQEYAVSQACRDCHLENKTGWRSPVVSSTVRKGKRPERSLEPARAAAKQAGSLSEAFGPSHHVQRFGVPQGVVPNVWTVASHAQEEPNLLCASCHTLSPDPPGSAERRDPSRG